MKIVLVGPPGSGKSTQGLKIRNDFNFQRVSTGDVFREYFREHNDFQGVYTKQNLDNGVLCSDEIMNQFVADEILTPVGERLILDGYPRTCAQARAFDLLMRKRGERYIIIHFSLKNDDMILERILLRGEKREDDSTVKNQQITKQYKKYFKKYYSDIEEIIYLGVFGTNLLINLSESKKRFFWGAFA